MNTVKQREVNIPLGIIVEKRKSTHPWADWNWTPVAVFTNPDEVSTADGEWQEMMKGEDYVRYHAGNLILNLHRKETEALRLNLMLERPELYVVMMENENPKSPFPYIPHLVTASSYDSQDFADVDDNIVEKVAMPEAVCALIQAFVEEHHVEEVFVKRKRDKLRIEEHKFGKEPIFISRTRH